MTDIFKDILPSILQTKESVIDSFNEKEYEPFLINRALSYHVDTILYANEMNKCCNLDRKLQYDYLLNTVKGKKRPFQKWFKYNESEEISMVKEYFGYSTQKAKDCLKLLTAEQLQLIKDRLNKGGVINERRHI